MHDLIIVGAGPAGLSAAITAKKHQLSTLVISPDLGGSLLEWPNVWSIPAYSSYGPEIVKRMQEELSGTEFLNAEVTSITKGLTLFLIEYSKLVRHRAKSIIIASGKQIEMTGVLGEDDFLGKGITTKPISELDQVKGKSVAVIGNDERAASIS